MNSSSGLITSFFDGLVTFVDVASLLGLLSNLLNSSFEDGYAISVEVRPQVFHKVLPTCCGLHSFPTRSSVRISLC